MGQPVMLPSFAAGELSPSLYARVDLAKWHAGAALLENFFVDYRGGVSNRTGTRFIGDSLDASQETRLVRFIFSNVQAYCLVFENQVLRFIMNGGFVQSGGADYSIVTPYEGADLDLLKFAQSADVMTICHPNFPTMQLTRTAHDHWTLTTLDVTSSVSAPTGVTAVPAVGAGATTYNYVVTAVATNGVTESLPSDVAASVASAIMSATAAEHQTVSWSAVPGSQLYNVYRQAEVPGGTPVAGQLFGFVGTANGLSFVDANIAPDFTRTPPQDFNPFSAGGVVSGLIVADPGSLYNAVPVLGFSGGGGAGAAGTVTMKFVIPGVTFPNLGLGYVVGDVLTSVGGTFSRPIKIVVAGVSGAGAVMLYWSPGFHGSDGGDFSVLPPNPVNFTGGTGAGFQVNVSWGVNVATVTDEGSDYTSAPAVAVTGGGGAGAAISAVFSLITNNPSCSSYYQQRQVFAATNQAPQTFWMSKTGDYANFGYSSPSRPDDSIVGTLASQQVNTIKHLVPLQSLIALTAGGAWRIDSGAQGGAVTPSTIEAIPQVFNGCSDVPPLVIGRELLYIQAKGTIVRDLSFNFIENVYSGNDMTTLANHLFFGHQIVAWDYAEEPFKIVWAVRDDGVLLSFTFLKDQEVYAWSHHVTDGRFSSVAVVPEGAEDGVYVVVERYIQGVLHRYVERFASRDMGAVPEQGIPADLARAWFVDCGLAKALTYPAAVLTPSDTTATYSIESVTVINPGSGYTSAPSVVVTDATGSGAVLTAVLSGTGTIASITVVTAGSNYTQPTITFVGGAGSGASAAANLMRIVSMTAVPAVTVAAGDKIRVNHGWGTVQSSAPIFVGTLIQVSIEQPLSSVWPAISGEWSCTTPVSAVAGLGHLEGATVAILADGNVMPEQQVSGGRVTLETPASAIVVGLPYVANFESLYCDIPGEQPTVQGKRKKISAVTARLQDSRGVEVGMKGDTLTLMKDREFELMGQPVLPFTGDRRTVIDSKWDVAGQVQVRQANPLPVTLLGLMPELSVGDTP